MSKGLRTGAAFLVHRRDHVELCCSLPAADEAREGLVAEWIHFTLSGIIVPTIKLKV